MAWEEGKQTVEDLTDWNDKLDQDLKGDLEYELARRTAGKFLLNNPGIFVKFLTGFQLEPAQRLVIKGWMQKNFALTIAGRGWSKSFLFAHFAYLYCLTHPNHHVLITSATFRSSRQILLNIDTWARRKEGIFLRQTIKTSAGNLISKKQDLYMMNFQNGSSIKAVPLGDSNKLRSLRCNVLGIDEGLLIPDSTIELVLKPFLASGADITQKQNIRARENRLIEEGKMTEEERIKFKSTSKMIILSSASYQWEPLYDRYKKYIDIIQERNNDNEKDGTKKKNNADIDDSAASYLVHQLSYKTMKAELIDPAIKEELESDVIPESVKKREYEAQFVQESEGYYSARKMGICTIEDGKTPTIEIVGERGAEYIVAIDPNVSSSPYNDNFAICVMKIVQKTDGKKVGMVVHQHAFAGIDLSWYIRYFYYILIKFNVVYIACDTTSGDNLDFINICNESEIFKTKNIELKAMDVEFGRESFDHLSGQIQRSYNKQDRRIVHKQSFHASFQYAANQYLQACIDYKNVIFAGKALSVPNLSNALSQENVMNLENEHPEFADTETGGSMYEFIQYQDNLMDQLKKECALVEMKSNSLGTISFDIPLQYKKSKNSKRPRKDLYSALLLANWGLKLYLESQSLPQEEEAELGALWVGR